MAAQFPPQSVRPQFGAPNMAFAPPAAQFMPPPGLAPMPGASFGIPPMMLQFQPPNKRNLRKEAEFARGLYVYNFEEITVEILFTHFNKIKPVAVIKFPKTKQRVSKKFAFVYFHSKEDANYVREMIQKDT